MARGLFRKTSFNKIVGAYRSQWKRFWMRLFTFGMYGRKGMGWWNNPKKAWYNFWYHRTSISIPRLLGYKPSRLWLFCAMLVASVASIFAAPVDATRAGIKAHKIKSARKARAESTATGSSSSTRNSTGSSNRCASGNTRTSSDCESGFSATASESTNTNTRTPTTHTSGNASKKTSPSGRCTTAKPRNTSTTAKAKISYTPPVTLAKEEKPKQAVPFTSPMYSYEPFKPVTPPEPEVKELDESTPKFKPKHEKDQYIRKRMIIAGSSYCDKAILDRLEIGTYIELEAEPNNPYDKDAVMLMFEGSKIGYIAKKDNTPFIVCLRLNRKMYGVITDIITEQTLTKYEFETWFSSEK